MLFIKTLLLLFECDISIGEILLLELYLDWIEVFKTFPDEPCIF